METAQARGQIVQQSAEVTEVEFDPSDVELDHSLESNPFELGIGL